ncbi:type 4a pilus biogenesis protein PilO [Paenibacillus sp. FSL M7-0420]|uniref:type 4a pilus biogenesis protein PilO n=1 Tax=Paenibacillus sp. FSL M7-0420 TaxID=2921609 RepID=UPI0030F9568D
MEQINKYRSAIVLALLVLFLILFGFYMFAIRPVNNDIVMQDSEFSLLEQEKGILTNKINALKSEEQGTESSEDTLLAGIPQGDDSEALILALQRIGTSSHARLKDIGFSLTESNEISPWTGISPEAVGSLREIKMAAIVQGSYSEINEWLKQLHDLPRILAVDSFSFQKPYEFPTRMKPGSILTANVSFTAYFEATVPKSSD